MNDAGGIIGTVKGQQFVTCVCEHCGAIFRGEGSAPLSDAETHAFEQGHVLGVNVHYKLAPVREHARPTLRLVE